MKSEPHVETCNGPSSYVGPVYSFHAFAEDGFTRLDDETWKRRCLTEGFRARPGWSGGYRVPAQ